MIDLAIGLSLVALLAYLLGMWSGRVAERRRAPAPRADFDTELKTYLRTNDYILTTREMAARAWPIIESPHAPRGQAIVMNSDDIQKLIKSWPAGGTFGTRLDKHLPGCRKRHDPDAVCICSERGFGGSNPMPPKFAEEFRLLHEDEHLKPTSFKVCTGEWFTEMRCPRHHIHDGKHRCTRNRAHLIGPNPRCLCACGKTREGDLSEETPS